MKIRTIDVYKSQNKINYSLALYLFYKSKFWLFTNAFCKHVNCASNDALIIKTNVL